MINYNFYAYDLYKPYLLKTSKNGKFALIGYGDDEGQLVQFDILTKEISHYWTEGRYTFSMTFLNETHAIVGTNNGYVILIDLLNKVRIKSLKISNSTIKDIQYSKDSQTIFIITIDALFAFDASTLDIKDEISLDFNPWDILLIPNSNLIAIQGNYITLELYEYRDNSLNKIDSKSYGSENRDMTSITYNKERNWLISASETGFIYIWDISNKKLEQLHEVDLDGNRLYWIQADDNYIAFSSNKGAGYINLKENNLTWIPNTQAEGKIKLQTINNNSYLLYIKTNRELGLANLTTNELNIYTVEHSANLIDLTINGDILGATDEGFILANFLKDDIVISHDYDFNSREHNISAEKFLFNTLDDFMLLKHKNGTLSNLILKEKIIETIDFYQDMDSKIEDFYGSKILTSNYQEIGIIDTLSKEIKKINLADKLSTNIEKYKLLNENKILLISSSNYSDNISIGAKIMIIDTDGNLKYEREIETSLHFISVYGDKIVEADIMKESTIFDLNTHKIVPFNIGCAFGENDNTMLFDECRYCIRLTIADSMDVSYELNCYDLTKQDANNRSQKIWEAEDPILSNFTLLGYCKVDNNFYIINKQSGELLSIDIENGNIAQIYKLQENIIDIQMSNSGKYIVWKLKTGEFSYISYPFQSCKISGSKQWRSKKVFNEENEVFLKHSSVAELWWETFKMLNPNRALKSAESERHQLDPLNYTLSIPNEDSIDNYIPNNAINALLGKGEKENLKNNDEVATIYHELFHVYQSNTTVKVFDYFYLIDDIQRKRKELLKYLGYCNFYPIAESTNTDFGKTVFHSVENYTKLGNFESFLDMLNEELKNRYKEIDDDIEKLVYQYGETYREQIEQEAQNAKENYKEMIEKQIKDNILLIQKQSEDIKKYSDLSRHNIVSLIEFFKEYNDINLNIFHLIEGSAQIFGWCCAGYNIEEKFLIRKNELEKENISQNDTYERAYELFKDAGGKTPLIFILLSTYALSMQNPIDTYLFGLQKINSFEANLQKLLINTDNTTANFDKVVAQIMDIIENAYKGRTFTKDMRSVHDKKTDDSFFIKNIHNIREIIPNSNDFKFISELLLNQNTALKLINIFKYRTEDDKQEMRKSEVLRDFEKFLYARKNVDFKLKCCSSHGYTNRYDYDWLNCKFNDSFSKIISEEFKVELPSKLKD